MEIQAEALIEAYKARLATVSHELMLAQAYIAAQQVDNDKNEGELVDLRQELARTKYALHQAEERQGENVIHDTRLGDTTVEAKPVQDWPITDEGGAPRPEDIAVRVGEQTRTHRAQWVGDAVQELREPIGRVPGQPRAERFI